MNNILSFISSLKIVYLVLIILIMVIINIILGKIKLNSSYKYLINGISLIILSLVINYTIDVINGIFSFRFFSIKLYIIVLIITDMITLINVQKKIKLLYKIVNYLLFGLINLILIVNLGLVTLIKLELLSLDFIQYIVVLLNISFISFIIYLTIISFIYIALNLNCKIVINDINIPFKKLVSKKDVKITTRNEEVIKSQNILTLNELLELPNKEHFIINGVECGIIFEDSIPENIIKNYHILLNDINAKLVNGYTLEENRLLKSICTKLKTNNLNYIDLNNLSILNKISVEEYNFLKQIYK